MFISVGLFTLLLVGVGVAAQGDLTESYMSADGAIAFRFPDSWEIGEERANAVELTDSSVTLTFYGPSFVEDANLLLGAGGPEATLSNVLKIHWETVEGMTIVVDGSDVVGAYLSSDDPTEAVLLVDLGDDKQGIVHLVGPTADVAANLPTELAIITSFGDLILIGTAQDGAPCMIRTDQERTVRVHVGPGTNRTSIAFLPANEDFAVLGQTAADDGSMWWKLDKEAVAPDKAAAETWVSQDDVQSMGDCASVVDSAAPPIIAITRPQPTPVPGSGEAPAAPAGPVTAGSGTGLYISGADNWLNALPAGIRASSLESASLVAYVAQSLEQIQDCGRYVNSAGDSITATRMRVKYSVSVVNPDTGDQVAQNDFFGANPEGCPGSIFINTTLNGPPPTIDAALSWFMGLLGG